MSDFHGASYDDLDLMIRKVARQVARDYRFENEYERVEDDLVGAGWQGVAKARARFVPRYSGGKLVAKFSSYAYYDINGQIRREALRMKKWDNATDEQDDDTLDMAYEASERLDVLEHFNEDVLTPQSRRTIRELIRPMLEQDVTVDELAESFDSPTWVREQIKALKEELISCEWRTDE